MMPSVRFARRGGPVAALCGWALILGVLAGCAGGGDESKQSAAGAKESATGEGAAAESLVVDQGLSTPESVLWDEKADVYLVSNINGDPTAHDGNGFISKIVPDGRMESLKWIDGSTTGVRLNAPKGMAISGDTLFVADIDTVRAFDRLSGRPIESRGVPGATFLNDLTVGPNGVLYVTDSGLTPEFKPSGTDAVYRFENKVAVPVAACTALRAPNGIIVTGDSLTCVTFGGNQIERLPMQSAAPQSVTPRTLATTPAGALDGIVGLPDGSLLVSSWADSAVYRVGPGGQPPEKVIGDIPSPADIGWDAKRSRVLVPVFQENRVVIRTIH